MHYKLPPRLKPGDKVAIVSPSSGLASDYPWVYELGLNRLRELFGLEPIEFKSALASNDYLHDNPQVRAEDINKAFADPEIKAIITTIGGNDQIRILPYLDPTIIQSNPKIFLGYSDATNLHLYLNKLGIISYYGGSLMNQFAMQGEMYPYTIHSIKKSLFEPSIGQIEPAPYFTDCDLDWDNQEYLTQKRPLEKNTGWAWYNTNETIIKGYLWGGCLEILSIHLALKSYLPSHEEFKQTVLYVETSEELPPAGDVYRFFATLGELKILSNLKGILVGRPKAQFLGLVPPEGSKQFIENQEMAIKQALKDYQISCPVIFNLNFGHTDPQMLIPNGGLVSINGSLKTLSFEYPISSTS